MEELHLTPEPKQGRLARFFKDLIESAETANYTVIPEKELRTLGRTALPPDIQAQIDMPDLFGPNSL